MKKDGRVIQMIAMIDNTSFKDRSSNNGSS